MTTGTPKLSEVARHLVVPDGIVSTGWPAVRDTCHQLGVGFDSWQDGAGRLFVAKRADGLYAADAVVLSIARQVGKTYLVGWIIFALCIIHPGLTVIWTAHRYKTASETYDSMRAMALRPKMQPHVDRVPQGAGNQAVIFKNGSRVLFGARERGFGRGFTMVDVLVFDEAQILTDNAIDDMVPATNQAPNPLVFFMGTPPKPTDPSEVFTRHRAEALSGESADEVYIEISADKEADPRDVEQWAKANPSYPTRTTARAMLRMRKNLTPDAFMREGLGVWDDMVLSKRPIAPDDWTATTIQLSDRKAAGAPTGRLAFVLDVPPGMRSAVISVTGILDGKPHSELVAAQAGTEWVAPRLTLLSVKHPDAVLAYDSTGAAGALIPAISAAGLSMEPLTGKDMQSGAAHMQALSLAHGWTHTADPILDTAFSVAVKRDVGDGGWDWGRRKASGDISPLRAVTGGQWVLEKHRDDEYDLLDSAW